MGRRKSPDHLDYEAKWCIHNKRSEDTAKRTKELSELDLPGLHLYVQELLTAPMSDKVFLRATEDMRRVLARRQYLEGKKASNG